MPLTRDEFEKFFDLPVAVWWMSIGGDGWQIHTISRRFGEAGAFTLLVGLDGEKANGVTTESFYSAVLGSPKAEGSILERIREVEDVKFEVTPRARFA